MSSNEIGWSTLPSLHPTLRPDDVLILEEAICAYLRGEYTKAKTIIEKKLSSNHSLPIVAIALADVYDGMSLQTRRLEVLNRALTDEASWSNQAQGHERLLLRILRAHAGIMCDGRLRYWYRQILMDRKELAGFDLMEANDIDVRYLIEFRKLQSLCFSQSNYHLGLGDRYLFRHQDLTERNELEDLSLLFEARRDLHAAVRLACLNAREDTTPDAWPANLQRVENLSSQVLMSHTSSDLHRALWSQAFAVKLVVDKDITTNVEPRLAQCASIVVTLRARGLECPELGMELRMIRVTQMPLTLTSVEQTLLLADEAHQDHNYSIERRYLLKANRALAALHRTQPLDEKGRTILKQVRSRRLELEEEDCQSIFYVAHALVPIDPVPYTLRGAAWYIKHCSQFFKQSPNPLDLPQIVYSLARDAEKAAKHISDTQAMEHFRPMKLNAQIYCPFAEHRTDFSFSMTAEARNDPLNIQIGIYSPDRRIILQNAVVLAIEWAIAAFQKEPTAGIVTTVSAAHMISVVLRIFGSADLPTDDKTWHEQFDVVESWLRDGCEASFEKTRHWILLTLQQSRCYTLLQRLINQNGLKDDAFVEELYRARLEEIRVLQSITLEARGPNHSIQVAIVESANIVTWACSITAIKNGRVTDAMLECVMENLGDQICDFYRDTGQSLLTYYTLKQRASAAVTRHICWESVEPDAGLKFLEAADQIYSQLRRQASSTQFIKGVGTSAQVLRTQLGLIKSMCHEQVYQNAISITMEALRRAGKNPEADQKRQMVTKWVERSKASSLVDELGVGSKVPKRLLSLTTSQLDYEDVTMQRKALLGELTQTEQLRHITKKMEAQKKTRLFQSAIGTNASLQEIAAFRDGASVMDDDIENLLQRIGQPTCIVSYVLVNDMIFGVFYQEGIVPNVFHIRDLSMAQVRAWTSRNLQLQDGHEPLHSQAAWSELSELEALVRGIDTIPEDSMIVFCPTRQLHGIPLHALSTGKQIIIERNPVAYTQSLSILHRCQLLAEDVANHDIRLGKTAILCVVDETWHDVATYEDIGQLMRTKPYCVQYIASEDALEAMAGASILHFHGHAHTNDSTGNHLGMESYLSLGKMPPVTGLSRTEKLTANDIIDLTLHPGALALLIACRSGSADVSSTDDLLGLPTALLYAGATSVIGTLWEINNEDGMLFSETFYERLMAEKDNSIKTGAATVNVAVVLRKTILHIMRQDGTEKVMPYHWASFTLTGFWEIPLAFLQA